MAVVEFRRGDVLNIIWTSLQNTPLGRMDVESSFSYPYEELLQRLRSKGGKDGSKRSTSPGAKFSRVVALLGRCETVSGQPVHTLNEMRFLAS